MGKNTTTLHAWVLVILCVTCVYILVSNQGRRFQEYVMFSVDPSAERAMHYAEKYFSALNPDVYDINRAEFYFRKAAQRNPSTPNLYHELARIAFLRGDFSRADSYINMQIALHGDQLPNAYYIRGLIAGFAGDYDAAAKDYVRYLNFDPSNWAANNDLAWVLLKAGRSQDALYAADRGLEHFPNNAWLLNSRAIALYELGDYTEAISSARLASSEVEKLQAEDWLRAYPGNDPRVAEDGLSAFQQAVRNNMHRIEDRLVQSNVQ